MKLKPMKSLSQEALVTFIGNSLVQMKEVHQAKYLISYESSVQLNQAG